jgi:hypothetical protein
VTDDNGQRVFALVNKETQQAMVNRRDEQEVIINTGSSYMHGRCQDYFL